MNMEPRAVFLDWRLRECNYGTMNGMSRKQLEAERRRRLDDPFPDGESWRAAVARVRRFLDELVSARKAQRVVLIRHVATRWALDEQIHGIPLEQSIATPFRWQEGWEYSLRATSDGG